MSLRMSDTVWLWYSKDTVIIRAKYWTNKRYFCNKCFIVSKFNIIKFKNLDYEYKQTRNLIRSISSKINSDFSSNAMLIRRDKTITNYINEHYTMLFEFEKNRNTIFYLSPRTNANTDTKKTLINLNFTDFRK